MHVYESLNLSIACISSSALPCGYINKCKEININEDIQTIQLTMQYVKIMLLHALQTV